jgi:hypothetical protein
MSFYDSIIEKLKEEAKCLNDKLYSIRECKLSGHMNDYIATLKSLRETLDLIHKYDWQLMYSEYGVEIEDKITVKNDDGNQVFEVKNNTSTWFTEIAVWEQNHEGQVRNHKIWRTNIPYKDSNRLKIGTLDSETYYGFK